MASAIKQLVSKKKRRFVDKQFNLDLSYIGDRIIAMGFPAENMEAMYRNSLEEVKKFLDDKHKDHYWIYNLCSERKYDSKKFQGRVTTYPFDDHNPPSFSLIRPFCEDVDEWLEKDPKNVAVIHCKAGKGRTGTMICCYLLHRCCMGKPVVCESSSSSTESSGQNDNEKAKKDGSVSSEGYSSTGKTMPPEVFLRTTPEVLEFYGELRTLDKKGVTIPSQKRYIDYYSHTLRNRLTYKPVKLLLRYLVLDPVPTFTLGNEYYLQFIVKQGNGEPPYESDDYLIKRNHRHAQLNLSPAIPVCGDVKIEFAVKNNLKAINVKPHVLKAGSSKFHFWFNTYFVGSSSFSSILCHNVGTGNNSLRSTSTSNDDDQLMLSPSPRQQHHHQNDNGKMVSEDSSSPFDPSVVVPSSTATLPYPIVVEPRSTAQSLWGPSSPPPTSGNNNHHTGRHNSAQEMLTEGGGFTSLLNDLSLGGSDNKGRRNKSRQASSQSAVMESSHHSHHPHHQVFTDPSSHNNSHTTNNNSTTTPSSTKHHGFQQFFSFNFLKNTSSSDDHLQHHKNSSTSSPASATTPSASAHSTASNSGSNSRNASGGNCSLKSGPIHGLTDNEAQQRQRLLISNSRHEIQHQHSYDPQLLARDSGLGSEMMMSGIAPRKCACGSELVLPGVVSGDTQNNQKQPSKSTTGSVECFESSGQQLFNKKLSSPHVVVPSESSKCVAFASVTSVSSLATSSTSSVSSGEFRSSNLQPVSSSSALSTSFNDKRHRHSSVPQTSSRTSAALTHVPHPIDIDEISSGSPSSSSLASTRRQSRQGVADVFGGGGGLPATPPTNNANSSSLSQQQQAEVVRGTPVSLRLNKGQIDKAFKDKKCANFSDDFRITLFLLKPEDQSDAGILGSSPMCIVGSNNGNSSTATMTASDNADGTGGSGGALPKPLSASSSSSGSAGCKSKSAGSSKSSLLDSAGGGFKHHPHCRHNSSDANSHEEDEEEEDDDDIEISSESDEGHFNEEAGGGSKPQHEHRPLVRKKPLPLKASASAATPQIAYCQKRSDTVIRKNKKVLQEQQHVEEEIGGLTMSIGGGSSTTFENRGQQQSAGSSVTSDTTTIRTTSEGSIPMADADDVAEVVSNASVEALTAAAAATSNGSAVRKNGTLVSNNSEAVYTDWI